MTHLTWYIYIVGVFGVSRPTVCSIRGSIGGLGWMPFVLYRVVLPKNFADRDLIETSIKLSPRSAFFVVCTRAANAQFTPFTRYVYRNERGESVSRHWRWRDRLYIVHGPPYFLLYIHTRRWSSGNKESASRRHALSISALAHINAPIECRKWRRKKLFFFQGW